MKHVRVNFTGAPEASRRVLFQEVAPVWTEIFGTSSSDLECYWFETRSRQTNIHVLRDDAGAIAGTFTAKYHDVLYQGREITIIKFGVGLRSSARGAGFTDRCTWLELLASLPLLARREVYLFSTMIHPVIYHIVDKKFERFYPHYDRSQLGAREPELAQLSSWLIDYFGLTRIESRPPFVVREVRVSVETRSERARTHTQTSPAVAFYLRECPDYAQGACLTVLVPLTPRVIARGLVRAAKRWLARLLRRRRTHARS